MLERNKGASLHRRSCFEAKKGPNYILLNYFVEGYQNTSEAYYPENSRDNYR